MKKNETLIIALATMLLVSLVHLNVTLAAPNSVTFTVEPSEYNAWKKGEEFTVNITASDVEASERVVGVEFRLGYNDTLLEVQSITEGPFFSQFNQTSTPPSTFFIARTQGGAWGPHILVGILLMPNSTGQWPGPMPEGSGTMVEITFKAIYQPVEPMSAASCVLDLFNATAIDDSGTHLGVELVDGEYDIPAALYPIPLFTVSHDTETKGLITIFNATESYDPDGTIINYNWNLGDGTIIDTTEPVITHVYAVEGTYEATLTITDIDDLTASLQQTVVVGHWQEITVNIDAGSIHFVGEIADFSILVSHYGRPVNVTTVNALLYYEGSLFADLTSNVEQVSTGLYRVTYEIPSGAGFGTYTLVAHAAFQMIEGSNLKSFVISSLLSGFILDVTDGMATVTNDLMQVKMNLTAINATLYDVRGDIAILSTAVGELEAKLETINATVMSISGNVVAINSAVGRIEVDLDAINAVVTRIDGNVATINSTLGELKVIMGEPAQNTTVYITAALSAIAVLLAAVILMFVRKKPTS